MDNEPQVYLIHHAPRGAIYVGRPSIWGNPYPISQYRSREKSIAMFKEYAIKQLELRPNWLMQLWNKDLVCHCAPKSCHADILLEMARIDYQVKGNK